VVVDARSFDDEKSWSAITPRFIAEYAPSDGLLAYASASRGFKAGGFNTTALQPSFDPEFLWSFELGLKMRRADDRARLRAAVFWYDYDDLQLPTLAPDRPASEFPIIVNAARARILGLESEFSWRPLRGIETNLALALLDAEFRSFVSVDGNNPVDDPDRSGNRMPQAPELSTSAGVSYVRDLSGRGSVMARIDWSYRSRTYYNPFEDPEVDQGGYHLLRASAEYTLPSGRWSVALLGENLTDRLYAQNVFRIDSSTGALRFWGPPRTVSVRLRGRF
jgi:iron complex outermembrane receptor protein